MEHQDVLVICPVAPNHLARVVKVPAGIPWLKVEWWLLRWELRYSPMRWFDAWKGRFKGRAGAYVAARLAILLVLCMGLDLSRGRSWHSSLVAFSYSAGVLFLVDLLASNTSIAFVSRFPANPIRSAMLTLLGLITLASIFALFFLGIPDHFTPELNTVSALYYSLVTLATLGYGDIRPCDNHPVAQLMVFGELVVGAYFVMVIVAMITSWGTNPKRFRDPIRLEAVRPAERPS
jgi:hypothetical protein